MTPETVALVLLSALLHAVWTALIKDSRDPLAFNFLQALPFVPLAAALALVADLSDVPARVWRILAASSVIHAFYIVWMSRALSGADLSVAYPIMRSTPAFLPLVAIPLLGESISVRGAAGIAVTVLGMWLVHTRGEPRWRAFVRPGTGFAYLVLLATVGYSLTDKAAMAALGEAEWRLALPRALAYFLLMGAGHTLWLSPFVLRRIPVRTLVERGREEWRRIGLAIAGSTASYTLILEALREAPVSYVATVRQTSVLFAVGIGAFWLGERPGAARLLGAALTVAGVALVANA